MDGMPGPDPHVMVPRERKCNSLGPRCGTDTCNAGVCVVFRPFSSQLACTEVTTPCDPGVDLSCSDAICTTRPSNWGGLACGSARAPWSVRTLSELTPWFRPLALRSRSATSSSRHHRAGATQAAGQEPIAGPSTSSVYGRRSLLTVRGKVIERSPRERSTMYPYALFVFVAACTRKEPVVGTVETWAAPLSRPQTTTTPVAVASPPASSADSGSPPVVRSTAFPAPAEGPHPLAG